MGFSNMLRTNVYILALFLLPATLQAQFNEPIPAVASTAFLPQWGTDGYNLPPARNKLMQRNHGVIIGLQRGQSTALELGGEAHWRKMSLKKPHIIGATANMEYNFSDHMIGYKAGMWMKRGRINFTYGANVLYYTDFKGQNIYGIGPSIGFRLLGLHLVNGYNFLGGDKGTDKEPSKVNTLYMSIRYYIPVQNKFSWDRKGREKKLKEKEKKKKRRAKEKRKKEREGDKNGNKEKKPLFGIKGLHL
jgi:hypothetical protein